MTDNAQQLSLLQKADIALNQFAGGGLLQNESADEFMKLAIRKAVLLPMISAPPMDANVKVLPRVRFAGRVLQPGAEGTALPFAQRSAPELTSYTLTARLYRAQSNISDEVLEDNVEGGTFESLIREELGKAISRDLEFVGINGDDTSAVALLAVQDGWLVASVANLVPAAGAGLSSALLRDAMRTMPEEFSEDPALKFFTNRFAKLAYMDELRQRATDLGDKSQSTTPGEPAFWGHAVKSIPEWPANLGAGANQTQVLLTDPKNLVMGVQRQIKFEVERSATAGMKALVASLRVAFNVAEPRMTVRVDAVAGA